MTTHTHHRPSAAEGLHSYGLAGIDLQRTAERRDPGVGGLAATRQPGLLHRMRQAAGDAFVRLGTGIAGEMARPAVTPAIRSNVDIA